MAMRTLRHISLLIILLTISINGFAQDSSGVKKAPQRTEGEGPWEQLIIRGVTVIDGTKAPAYGPVDVVVEQDKIKNIVEVGAPGTPIDPDNRPTLKENGK